MASIIHKIYDWVKSDDMSCQQISTEIIECNGNIILGCEIPDEILLQIFQYINDESLIKVIPAVCKHWHELSRSWQLWKVRLKMLGIRVSKGRLERFLSNWSDPKVVEAIQCLCVYNDVKGINHNLLKNPSGAQKFTHWKIQNGGDGLIVEETPAGCDPIPPEAHLASQHCFVSSYGTCKRSQSVSLCRDFNLKPSVLEVLRPSLHISEWVSARWDCGAESMNQTTVIGTNSQPAIFIIRWKDSDYGRVEWHQMSKKVNFEELPENMSTIRFKNLSRDTQFWAGNYGAKSAGSSIVLDISTD